MLPYAKRLLAWTRRGDLGAHVAGSTDYLLRVAAERATFEDVIEVHELPPIFHYWSNKYLRPKVESMGFSHPDDFFVKQLAKLCQSQSGSPLRFVSIGAGNCDTEVRVAKALVDLGHREFVIECLDINPSMLDRGRELARQSGVETQVLPIEGDFNAWQPQCQYDAVIANQSLHHVLKLEHLFDAIKEALPPHGRLITSDMIGRNGHQRWPEAKAIVQEYWNELPTAYRYNRQLRRQEDVFMDWDCSISGFEGIRAQDILPLLVERFHFELFLPFANVISPFIDRSFGHNFNVDGEWDRAFIDRVHARDEAEMRAGNIKPTQMFAVLSPTRVVHPAFIEMLTPQNCVRPH